MPVKLRLARRGRKKQPFYHIIAADARSPRDGKFIEKIGSYNPMTKPATIQLDRERALEWLGKGAQPTDTVRAILRFKGVMFKKHLQRGVAKGSLTQEEADQKYQAFIDEKEAKVAERAEQARQERLEFQRKVNGSPKAVYVAPTAADESAAEAFRENTEETATEEATSEAPAEEVTAEAPVEETPAVEATASEEE